MRRSTSRVRPGPVACLVFTRPELAGSATGALFRQGFTVVERPFASSFPELLLEVDPDVVIAAVDAGEPDDVAVLRFVVAHSSPRPVLALLTPYTEEFAAIALDAGAVAVLPSAASGALVGAQATALRRAAFGAVVAEEASMLFTGDLAIDLGRRTVARRGERIELTKSEFEIVALLARNAGRVMTPMEIVSGIGQFSTSAAQARGIVKVHVSHLRTKLGPTPENLDYVVTVRGVGYLLENLPSHGGVAAPEQVTLA